MEILIKVFGIGVILAVWGSLAGMGIDYDDIKDEHDSIKLIIFFCIFLPEVLGPVMMLISGIIIVILV